MCYRWIDRHLSSLLFEAFSDCACRSIATDIGAPVARARSPSQRLIGSSRDSDEWAQIHLLRRCRGPMSRGSLMIEVTHQPADPHLRNGSNMRTDFPLC